ADRVPEKLADDIDTAERGDQNNSRAQRNRRFRLVSVACRHGPGFLTLMRRAFFVACMRPPRKAGGRMVAPRSCPTCDSSIGERSRGLYGHPMTAIDFAAFVDQLASVS